jgi:hypothetical protein
VVHFRDSRPGLFLLNNDPRRDWLPSSGVAFQRFAMANGFSVRDLQVGSAGSAEDLLRLAGLDWDVIELPLHLDYGRFRDGRPLTGWRALARPDRDEVMSVETSHYSVANHADLLRAALEHCRRVAPSVPIAAVAYGVRAERVLFVIRVEVDEEPLFLLIRNSHGGSGAVRFQFTHLDPSGAVVVYDEPSATHAIPHVGKMREEKLPSFARYSSALRRFVDEAIPMIEKVRNTYWSPQRARGLVDHLWSTPPPHDPTPRGDLQLTPVDRFADVRATRAHAIARLEEAESADAAFHALCRYVDFESDAADKGDMTPDRDQRLTHGAGTSFKARGWAWIRRNT